MRQAIVIGMTIIAVLIFGQVLIASVGPSDVAAASVSADGVYAPEMQATATTTTTSPGTLPETGAQAGNSSGILLGSLALIIAGTAAVLLLANRRERSS